MKLAAEKAVASDSRRLELVVDLCAADRGSLVDEFAVKGLVLDCNSTCEFEVASYPSRYNNTVRVVNSVLATVCARLCKS
jgi:hypothetical protein